MPYRMRGVDRHTALNRRYHMSTGGYPGVPRGTQGCTWVQRVHMGTENTWVNRGRGSTQEYTWVQTGVHRGRQG